MIEQIIQFTRLVAPLLSLGISIYCLCSILRFKDQLLIDILDMRGINSNIQGKINIMEMSIKRLEENLESDRQYHQIQLNVLKDNLMKKLTDKERKKFNEDLNFNLKIFAEEFGLNLQRIEEKK